MSAPWHDDPYDPVYDLESKILDWNEANEYAHEYPDYYDEEI